MSRCASRITSAVVVLLSGSFVVQTAQAQPAPPEPARMRESKPATANEAKFVVIAETMWKPGKKLGRAVPIDIQLRITNDAKGEVVFPTFDTFGLRLIASDGKQIMPRGGRNVTGDEACGDPPGRVLFALSQS